VHGAKFPDEAIIDFKNQTLFILETKFQQVPGSICEKIQTPTAKIWSYKKMCPTFKIVYMFTLSNWFKKNCKGEIMYLNEINIPVFLGDSPTYKDNIINFIINYK
jgi:hypothetical protein